MNGAGGDDDGFGGFFWSMVINRTPTDFPSIEWIDNLNEPIITNAGDFIVFNG